MENFTKVLNEKMQKIETAEGKRLIPKDTAIRLKMEVLDDMKKTFGPLSSQNHEKVKMLRLDFLMEKYQNRQKEALKFLRIDLAHIDNLFESGKITEKDAKSKKIEKATMWGRDFDNYADLLGLIIRYKNKTQKVKQ